MNCCKNIAKAWLTIVSVILMAVGAGLVGLGAYSLSKGVHLGGDVMTVEAVFWPAIVLIIVGGFSVMLGVLGFAAVCSEHRCVAGAFATMLLVLLLGVVAAGLLCFIFIRVVDDQLHAAMENAVKDYGNMDWVQQGVDSVQQEFKCCGVDNYTDWLNSPWYRNTSHPRVQRYPESCCVSNQCNYTTADPNLYQKGCYPEVRTFFKHHLLVIGCVAGGFTAIIVISMCMSCMLCMLVRRRQQSGGYSVPYATLPADSDGMRV